MGVRVIKDLFLVAFLATFTGGTDEVSWYRTAQNTPERLTPQASLNFSSDFKFQNEIVVNRYPPYVCVCVHEIVNEEVIEMLHLKRLNSFRIQIFHLVFCLLFC